MEQITGEVLQENNQLEMANIKNDDLTIATQEKLKIKQKTQFEINSEDAITPEELREYMYKAIDEMWEK